jgi:hypothetical protein
MHLQQVHLAYLNPNVYQNEKRQKVNNFQTEYLSEFTILAGPLLLRRLPNLCQTFCIVAEPINKYVQSVEKTHISPS